MPSPQAAPDLHITLKSEFEYMSRIRPTNQDWWLGERRSRLSVGDRVSISREDLGINWRIDSKQGTYTESKRAADTAHAVPASSAKPAIDMHTVGYRWEPEYDWTVKETGNKAVIAGRPCREFSAAGDADYSESSVTFWGCEPISGVRATPNDAVLSTIRNASTQKMMTDTAQQHGGLWVLQAEERQEPAIAPTAVTRIKVEVAEAAAAPAGTFDLPAGLKKAGR
jgi:hypothetical protein